MSRKRGSAAGLAVAACFFGLAITPSLLPRGWVMQGVAGGIAAAFGYGLGAALSALVRGWWTGGTRARRIVSAAACAVAGVSLWFAAGWQHDQRALLSMPGPPGWSVLGTLAVAAGLFAALIVFGRCVRWCSRKVSGFLGRFLPVGIAVGGGVAFGALLVVALFQGFVQKGLVEVLNQTSSLTNGKTPKGVTAPVSALVSGGPGSKAPWTTLGLEGRYFTATATPKARISAFTGRPALEPIRVYAGLDSAKTPEERARLAVAEMARTGAFGRRIVAVITTTGSGWVDQRAAAALEYMYGGNTAIAATQYSYLPSWLSFLVDRDKATRAARTLLEAVRARVDALPAGRRPLLLQYGESLGSYGIETAAGSERGLLTASDLALLTGPPFANPLHYSFAERRDPPTPIWLPVYRRGEAVRFARPGSGPPTGGPWRSRRVLYLQNATDPIVWWSPLLITARPAWLDDPRGPDVSPDMHWIPLVTFWQVSVDLLAANTVPFGHGHRYGPSIVDALADLEPPPNWTPSDSARLRPVVAEIPSVRY